MDNKEFVWYVRDGVMHSGQVLAQIDFHFQVIDEQEKGGSLRYLAFFLKANGDTTGSLPRGIVNMAKRQGVWYLISGMKLVHTDDVFLSRESAAKAEFERLLEDDKQ